VHEEVHVVSVTFARCRTSYTVSTSSPDVTNDDVKYDVSNYARPPMTTTTFWTSSSRPPCQHWPPCNPDICLAATTTSAVCSSPGYRSSRLPRSEHILLSPAAADSLESGRLWDALESYDSRLCDSAYDRSCSPQRSRCLLHSSSAEVTSVDLN